MRSRFTTLAIAAAVLVVIPQFAGAQAPVTQTVSNATELDPDDPRAKRASALATALLAKDASQAQKYLKAHAIPGSPAATDIEKQVKEMREALAGGFVVDRVMGGNDDGVMVSLRNTSAERGGRMGIRLQIERDAPHRIREARTVQPRRQVGGGF